MGNNPYKADPVKIRELYASGLTYKEVAKKLGLSFTTVRAYIPTEMRRRKGPRVELRPEVLSMWEQGVTSKDIAQKLDLSRSAVHRQLRLTSPSTESFRQPWKPTERYVAMGKMYEDGKTLEEVGASFGVTRQRVEQVLSRIGVQRRPTGTWGETAKQYRANLNSNIANRIAELAAKGYSVKRIAERMGYASVVSVYRNADESTAQTLRQRSREEQSAKSRLRYRNPRFRARVSAMFERVWSQNPQRRKYTSNYMKRYWNDPAWRSNQMASRRAKAAKREATNG